MAKSTGRAVGCLSVLLMLVLLVAGAGYVYLRQIEQLPPSLFEDRCVVSTEATTVTLSTEQARNAAVIVGMALKRGLPSRAATVAIATAYQESGLRNLSHGDRDSLGLFQQRPSQKWGSPKQIMDPHYATGAFYDALIKINGWETMSINDAAQAVQRSGHPDAYAKHERNARAVAYVLLGEAPAAFSCLDRSNDASGQQGLSDSLSRTLGVTANQSETGGLGVPVRSSSQAWATAYHAIAIGADHGVSTVQTQGRTWSRGSTTVAEWGRGETADGNRVLIGFG